MKYLKYFAVTATFAVLLPTIAFAGGTQTGLIGDMTFRSGDVGTINDSLVVVNLASTSPKTGGPACATQRYWMIRDAKSEIGKQQIALLMTTKALGRSVTIEGTGTCTRWLDGEDILNIYWSQ